MVERDQHDAWIYPHKHVCQTVGRHRGIFPGPGETPCSPWSGKIWGKIDPESFL